MIDPDRRLFLRCFLRELFAAAAIAALIAPLVVVSNSTASLGLILLHAALLILVIPLLVCVASQLWRIAFPASDLHRSLAGELIVHQVGVIGGAAAMVPLLAFTTGIPAEVLASKPLIAGIIPVCASYGIWILMRHYRESRTRALSLEAENARRAWQTLSAQIKPHFLFNTLSCLEQLVDDDPARAKAGIARLAALYRSVLDGSEKRLVSVAESLAQAEDYLKLQQMRFRNRLRIETDVDSTIEDCSVPSTLLLTLVENAVKHGIEPSLKGGVLSIRIFANGDRLHLRVQNPAARGISVGNGHGLRDVKERLRLLFGDTAAFFITEENGTVTSEVCLPCETSDTKGGC